MKRDLDRLREPFDLVVIGAGIYGAAIAWDATLRGLRVALIDRGDIGGGTSFNNAKTLHGGVRSLQGLRLDELREYVRERRALLRIAPHLVRPLTFVSPALGTLTRNRLAFTAYFRAYDLLARDRNEGVDRALHLEGTRILGRDAYLALDPLSDPARVTGGVAWQDGQMLHGERVTLAFAKAAAAKGAVIATYLRADTALVDGGRVRGVRCVDVAPQPVVAPSGAAHEHALDVSGASGRERHRAAGRPRRGAAARRRAAPPGAGPVARAERGHALARPRGRRRRHGARPAVLRGAVARRDDRRHQPRALRGHGGQPGRAARRRRHVPARLQPGVPARRPDPRRHPPGAPRPAAHRGGRRRRGAAAQDQRDPRSRRRRPARARERRRHALHDRAAHRAAHRRSRVRGARPAGAAVHDRHDAAGRRRRRRPHGVPRRRAAARRRDRPRRRRTPGAPLRQRARRGAPARRRRSARRAAVAHLPDAGRRDRLRDARGDGRDAGRCRSCGAPRPA